MSRLENVAHTVSDLYEEIEKLKKIIKGPTPDLASLIYPIERAVTEDYTASDTQVANNVLKLKAAIDELFKEPMYYNVGEFTNTNGARELLKRK